MKYANRNYAFSTVFVEELARAGVRHVSISPGSRSSPLTLAFGAHPRIKTWVHPDERSGAFFALGLARALAEPVAVVCTSGTAAANYLPAVIESAYTRIPLIFLTADHPFETRGCGEPQVIDQTHIYGHYPKWFVDVGAPEITGDLLRTIRTIAGRAVATARAGAAGPVHVNFPFRKPLTAVSVPEDFPAGIEKDTLAWEGREASAPFVDVATGVLDPSPATVSSLAKAIRSAQRGVIVCGPQDDDETARAAVRLGKAAGFAVIADGLSQARSHRAEGPIVDRHDLFLRSASIADRLAPDLVLRVGTIPTSGPLVSYLRKHGAARQILIDEERGWRDPLHVCSEVVWANPASTCRALVDTLADHRPASTWVAEWTEIGAQTERTVAELFEKETSMFEGRAFAELSTIVPDGSTFYLGNSMPVRDFEAFFPARKGSIRAFGNRGAAGIDGVVSSALGAAAADRPGRTFLAIGDISFYHDMNGLLAAKLNALRATILVLNNDGGGIFSFLPESKSELFEPYFGTPHGLDFEVAAKLYDLQYSRVTSWETFREAVVASLDAPRAVVIEVPTLRRAENVALHNRIWEAVAQAIGGSGTRYVSP